MTPQFNIRFSIDRVNDELNLILTDTSDYTGVATYYGFYKIIYPDSVVVENTDVDNPDFENGVAITTIPLRLRQGIIQGEFSITQKSYTDIGDYELEKVFTLSFSEPSLIMSDNSNLVTPSVSFLDITQYVNSGYNPSVTRVIECKFPTTTTVTDTITTTSNEIFMLKDGKSYEGVYTPKLTSTALFTADEHEVQWIQEKSFEFDIRAFIAISQLIIEIDKVKDRLDNSKGNERELMDDYFMVTSLYTQLLANWGDGIYNDIAVTASTVNTLALEAAASALEALNSASEASTSEDNASTSESNASTSASTATTQAGIATTKAGEASTSESNASTSAGVATTQAGLAENSKDEIIASLDLVPGKNKFDKSTIRVGKYYSPSNNDIRTSSSYRCSDFIPVTPGQNVSVQGAQTGMNIGWLSSDSDGSGIGTNSGSGTSSGITFTAPSGANYLVLNITNEGQDVTTYDDTIQIEFSASVTVYEPYELLVPQHKVSLLVTDLAEKVRGTYLFDSKSKNLIDPEKINYIKRYSEAARRLVNDTIGIAASDYIPIVEGKIYTISGLGTYGISDIQGGFFDSYGAIVSIMNIEEKSFSGTSTSFQIPIDLGITHLVISLKKLGLNSGATSLDGNVQLELGNSATTYTPYELKDEIKPALINFPETSIDAELWYKYTEGEAFRSNILKTKSPIFWKNWLKRDKDLMVVNTGTSLTARTTEHCTLKEDADHRPPLFQSNNMASILWDKMKWDSQTYRRYDFASFFTELKTGFTTASNVAQWDDGTYRKGLTRYTDIAELGNFISFDIPINAFQFNYIFRTDSLGSTQVRVKITEGNEQVEVLDPSDDTWKEANNFDFSMRESAPVSRVVSVPQPSSGTFVNRTIPSKGNTTYQKRLKLRCKSGSIDSRTTSKTITLEKITSGRFLYWGVEYSSREFMITYVNAARGSHNTQADATNGLPKFADNEVWGFKPDLMFFELPIHNDGASGAGAYTAGYWGRLTNNYIFNASYELSFITRSEFLNSYVPEMITFTSSISWNFNGINEDGTLKIGEQTGGKMMTALDKYNEAVQWLEENHDADIGVINSVKRWVDAGFAIFGDLKTATLGSGTGGSTFTNEGSHWNDTGSKIIAKTLTGLFEFD